MKKCISLYIHIPFCMRKCFYCDFPSFADKNDLMFKYSKSLSRDIENIGDRKIRSIFIGGGTPTYLSLDCWYILKDSIDKLNKIRNCEFTIEGNPGTLTQDELYLFNEMGVNRLSLGLQACQDILLEDLGRIHTLGDFEESYNMARKAGFKNINVDLMFGLPNQTLKQWNETLEYIVDINPEHISCYSLIIEEGTNFYEKYKCNLLNLPSENIERNMYQSSLNILKRNGYSQYEISNFSKHGMKCRHNIVYWSLEDYIACGVSAHSYLNGVRYKNIDDINQYIKKVNTTGNSVMESHTNSLKENIEEFMFLGLRKTSGISISKFNRKFNIDINRIYGSIIKKHTKTGLLIKKGDQLYLSSRGLELSNTVMSDFIL